MRRMGGWNEPDLIQVKLVGRFARHREVGVMNGVECSSEKSESHLGTVRPDRYFRAAPSFRAARVSKPDLKNRSLTVTAQNQHLLNPLTALRTPSTFSRPRTEPGLRGNSERRG